jgi:hypothetical protein
MWNTGSQSGWPAEHWTEDGRCLTPEDGNP